MKKKLHEAFSPEESEKIYSNFLAIINDQKRRDRLVKLHGANAENVAYGTAVNQVKKQAVSNIDEPTTETPMDQEKLKEMVRAALSKPLSEKKKSTAFTSQYDDKFDDKRKDLPDGLQKSILKKQGELDEVNLGHNEISSIYQEGRFWIVSYKTMDGEKEKVFQSEDEARKFASTLNEDLDIGHEDNEPHMVKAELAQIGKYAMKLYKMVDQFEGSQEVDFPAWWQSKITTAKSMISSAKHYLEFELEEPKIDAMVDVASQEGAIDEEMSKKQIKKRGEIYDALKDKGMSDEKAGRIATSKAKDIAEGVFDRIKAQVKGTTSGIGQRLKNVGAAIKGNPEEFKNPAIASGMAKIKSKAQNFESDVNNMLDDLKILFPEDKLEKTPEIKELIDSYKQLLGSVLKVNTTLAKGKPVNVTTKPQATTQTQTQTTSRPATTQTTTPKPSTSQPTKTWNVSSSTPKTKARDEKGRFVSTKE